MFGLLKPSRELVGKRIRAVKEELEVSLTEFGKRLDLVKPTMNAYVQGYSLAPLEVIEKISKISGKKVGWFYFGEIQDYIRDYLLLKGYEVFLSDYSEVPLKIKEIFLTGDFKNSGWENDFGYPCEAFIDNCFSEIYSDTLKDYITSVTTEFIDTQTNLKTQQKEEAIILISSNILGYYHAVGDLEYKEKDRIQLLIKENYERNIKDKEISFNDYYLIGKLINTLADDSQTSDLINNISMLLTDKRFSSLWGGKELISIFQSIRPALIELYAEKTDDDFYDGFEK